MQPPNDHPVGIESSDILVLMAENHGLILSSKTISRLTHADPPSMGMDGWKSLCIKQAFPLHNNQIILKEDRQQILNKFENEYITNLHSIVSEQATGVYEIAKLDSDIMELTSKRKEEISRIPIAFEARNKAKITQFIDFFKNLESLNKLIRFNINTYLSSLKNDMTVLNKLNEIIGITINILIPQDKNGNELYPFFCIGYSLAMLERIENN